MDLELEEVKTKLIEIKNQGFIRTKRNGPTGVGFTLETLLGIEENNISSPDLGEIELKAQRENHTGMTTLFTFNNKAWQMKPLEAIKKYGSPDVNGRMGLYYTASTTPNSAGLFLNIDDDDLTIRSIDGNVITKWSLSDIVNKFLDKVSNVLLVKARVELRENIEFFHFHRARLLSRGTTELILKNAFNNGQLLIDLRLHDKGTSARNHGTAFRIYEQNIDELYGRVEEVEI
jgi:hypothetical protein